MGITVELRWLNAIETFAERYTGDDEGHQKWYEAWDLRYERRL
jgi:hypothetical protein